MCGFLLGAYYEASFSLQGIIYGVGSSIFVSLYTLLIKQGLALTDKNYWRLLQYNVIASLVMLVPFIIFSLEYEILSQTVADNSTFWAVLLLVGVFGFLVHISTFMVLKYASHSMYNTSGVIKTLLLAVLSVLVYQTELTTLVNSIHCLIILTFCRAL